MGQPQGDATKRYWPKYRESRRRRGWPIRLGRSPTIMLDRRVALFGGTLLACGMAASQATAQELTNIENAQQASSYVYAFSFPVVYDDAEGPSGFSLEGTSGKNTLLATLDPTGLRASITTMSGSYVYLSNAYVYAFDIRFRTSEDTTALKIDWDFDINAFFVPSRDFTLKNSAGTTIFSVSTFNPSDPDSGSVTIPVTPGEQYEFDLGLRYLGNIGTVFLNMTPIGSATPCPADLDGSGSVDAADLAIVLGSWGSAGATDLDGDGDTAGGDLAVLLGSWGSCSP